MSKGKYTSKRSRSSKSLVLVLALVMLITATVGGTLAWLSAESNTVENTFTSAKLFAASENFTLWEHEIVDENKDGEFELGAAKDADGKIEYRILPGVDLPKDPTITIQNLLENAYLYVEVTDTLPDDLTYVMDDCWTQIGSSNVYYYSVGENSIIAKGTSREAINIIKDKKIVVANEYTPADQPYVLSFKAYMVQSTGNGADAIEAWNNTYGNP